MPIDPSIPLSVRPPVAGLNPLELMMQGEQFKSMQQQRQLRQLQAAQLGETIRQQQGMTKDMAAFGQEGQAPAQEGQTLAQLAQPAPMRPPQAEAPPGPMTQTQWTGRPPAVEPTYDGSGDPSTDGSPGPPMPGAGSPSAAEPAPPIPGDPPGGTPPGPAPPPQAPAAPTERQGWAASIARKQAFRDAMGLKYPLVAGPAIERMVASDLHTVAMRKAHLEEAEKGIGMLGQLASTVAEAPDAQKPAYLQQMKGMATEMGWPGAAQIPEEWTPEAAQWVASHASQARDAKTRIEQQINQVKAEAEMLSARASQTKAQAEMIGAGTNQMKARTEAGAVDYQPTATGGLLQVPKSISGMQAVTGSGAALGGGGAPIPPGTPGPGAGVVGAGTVVTANGQPVMMKQGRDQEDTLRKEYQGLTKDYRTVTTAFGDITASAADHSPIGDLSLMIGFMKLKDPGSVVTGKELATVKNAGSIDEQTRGYYNQLVESKGLLDDKVRADIVERSGRLYAQHTQDYDKIKTQYTTMARRQGLDPSNVTQDYTSTVPNPPPRVVPKALVQELMQRTGKTQAQIEKDLKAKQYRIVE